MTHVKGGSLFCVTNSTCRRKPTVRPNNTHGMSLWCVMISSSNYQLCYIFGRTLSTISVYIEYALIVLERFVIFTRHAEVSIKWRTMSEMDLSEELLKHKPNGGLLPEVFAVMDGTRSLCTDNEDVDIHNGF